MSILTPAQQFRQCIVIVELHHALRPVQKVSTEIRTKAEDYEKAPKSGRLAIETNNHP